MNTIKRILNFVKLKFSKMDKLQVLLAAHAHYSNFESSEKPGPDRDRLISLNEEIDRLIDELITTFPEVKEPQKSIELTEETVKPTEKETVKKDNKDIPTEALVLVKPYYDCSIIQTEGKEPKTIKFEDSKINLPAFVSDKLAKQFNNVYPTVEELEIILDEVWDKISKGESNKDTGVYLKDYIGKYYTKHGLTNTGDYYKITNPYSKLTKILRRAFSEGYDDYNVLVTRPSYTLFTESNSNIIMKKEFDCITIIQHSPDNKEIEKESNKEEKGNLKTIQTQKPTSKEKVMDEEAQEEEIVSNKEESQELEETNIEEIHEDEPPKVNSFESFNDIEKLIFQKLKEGNLKALKEKNPQVCKTIKSEAREDAKLLIQSRFDGEDWVEKGTDGLWKPAFLRYWNDIIKEIGTHINTAPTK